MVEKSQPDYFSLNLVELEAKVRSLENMVLRGGAPSSAGSGFSSSSHDPEEYGHLSEKIAEQNKVGVLVDFVVLKVKKVQ